jgi:allantoicase
LTPPEWTTYPDLASRALGGSVVTANDELFAQRENLIRPEPPVFDVGEFGHKGKVYDGWETRRRRESGNDWAIVRLGVPGIIHGIVVDTSWFTGNYPPFVSLDGAVVDGFPSPAELANLEWLPLVEKSAAVGDSVNVYDVDDGRAWTHVRLSIYPDGGVARLRVHGEPVPDPRFMTGTIDLAALENGGRLIDCSDAFYSSAGNLIMPGRAAGMHDGWENARRRGGGNDYVRTFAIRGAGTIDGTSDTDGIDVTTESLGPAFPNGLFVAQDGANCITIGAGSCGAAYQQNQDFKLVPFGALRLGAA